MTIINTHQNFRSVKLLRVYLRSLEKIPLQTNTRSVLSQAVCLDHTISSFSFWVSVSEACTGLVRRDCSDSAGLSEARESACLPSSEVTTLKTTRLDKKEKKKKKSSYLSCLDSPGRPLSTKIPQEGSKSKNSFYNKKSPSPCIQQERESYGPERMILLVLSLSLNSNSLTIQYIPNVFLGAKVTAVSADEESVLS